MFKLPSPDDTFPTRCVIETPVGEESEDREIVIHFRVIAPERWDELARQGYTELARELIGGWQHVCDAEGAPLSCTAENVALCVAVPYFLRGVILGYAKRFSPLKNLRGPLDA